MFTVLTWPRGKRPQAYGPFPNLITASDFSHEHTEETGVAAEVRPLNAPPVYGEEGL